MDFKPLIIYVDQLSSVVCTSGTDRGSCCQRTWFISYFQLHTHRSNTCRKSRFGVWPTRANEHWLMWHWIPFKHKITTNIIFIAKISIALVKFKKRRNTFNSLGICFACPCWSGTNGWEFFLICSRWGPFYCGCCMLSTHFFCCFSTL